VEPGLVAALPSRETQEEAVRDDQEGRVSMERVEVAVDAKGRISLAWRVHTENKLFLAEEAPSGIIVLTPGALVPAVVRISPPVEDIPPGGLPRSRMSGRSWRSTSPGRTSSPTGGEDGADLVLQALPAGQPNQQEILRGMREGEK
jgi:hypothetical protein